MVSRRALLRAFGVSLAAGSAGCNALGDGNSNATATRTATATPSTTPTATLRPSADGDPVTPTRTATPTRGVADELEGASLTPSAGTTSEFGRAVALSDAAAVVLAEGEGAYVFERDGDWRPTAVLTPDDEPDFGGYHVSAAMVGREAVLGGPGVGSERGAVYLFERTDGGWRQRHRFTSGDERDEFGRSVAFDGDRVVVGDNNDPTTMRSWSGSAYVFTRDGSAWTQEAALGRDAEDLFGTAVAVAGETVLVGAPYAEVEGEEAGAVYGYALVDGEWQRRTTLTADDAVDGSQFGRSVATDGSTAVVGAPGSGSGYVFERINAGWTRRARLAAESAGSGGAFGRSVAYVDGVAVVGAPKADESGHAYAFETTDGWTNPRRLHVEAPSENADVGSAVAIHDRTALVGAPVFGESSPAYVFEL